MQSKRYSPDLTPAWKKQRPAPEVPAEPDLVVEEVTSGFCGAVIRCEKTAQGPTVTLEDRFGKHRVFPMEPRGFLLEGKVVTLVRPQGAPAAERPRTNGLRLSRRARRPRTGRPRRAHLCGGPARCRAGGAGVGRRPAHRGRRRGVPGGHRRPAAIVRGFSPGPDARLGVLVDHLVPGSKESRIAAEVTGAHALVVGHPYIDVWEAVKPSSVGIPAWPAVPHGQDWKTGVCRALGWPENTGAAWQRILSCVRSYKDLEAGAAGEGGGVDRLRYGRGGAA